jgi:hypothetical protein
MYINFTVLHKYRLTALDLVFLVAIKQCKLTYLEENLTDSDYKRLDTLSLLKHIKAKHKDESLLVSLRLSNIGVKILADLSYEGAVDEETEILANWLINIYKEKNGGIVKNKTEIKRRIQWFKTITQIKDNRLAVLLQCFIQDTYNDQDGLSVKEFMEQNSRGVLSNMLDNVCWNPASLYDRHRTLDKSPLWQYYEDNLEYVNQIWKSKNLE